MTKRSFWLTFLLTTLWINLSEVFRYFVIVMPQMRLDLAMVPNVAPMNWGVFAIWGLWDTLLTLALMLMTWLFVRQWGHNNRTALLAGTALWLSFFVLFWLALYNMNLAQPHLLILALPLSWFEMVVGSLIATWSFFKFANVKKVLNATTG